MIERTTDTVNVSAVIVSFNRRELLRRSLRAVREQTHRPAAVVVVDNASQDGSAQMVAAEFPEVRLIQMESNIGGAGGFAAGMAAALAAGADALWVMDDDTVPQPEALAGLVAAKQEYRGPTAAVVASRVVWTDGRDHPMNTPRTWTRASASERRAAQEVGCRPIRSASFVSVLVDADLVRRRGLPVADYFLWNDDFEFTTRLIRGNRGLACPRSVVVHHTKVFGDTAADPGERFFYEVRNKVWLFTRSHGLTPAEKVIFAGSTLRRWVQTAWRSEDRKTLAGAFANGLKAGLGQQPRRTADVLTEASQTAGD